MTRITGLKVAAPWAQEGNLGPISISGGVRPALLFSTPRLSRQEAKNAAVIAAILTEKCQAKYPGSTIEIDLGLFYQPFSWIVFAGDVVESEVRDVVELARIEASGTVPFFIKPLIFVEFELLRIFYDPAIPRLKNAPVDGALLMLKPYFRLAWYVANGRMPT